MLDKLKGKFRKIIGFENIDELVSILKEVNRSYSVEGKCIRLHIYPRYHSAILIIYIINDSKPELRILVYDSESDDFIAADSVESLHHFFELTKEGGYVEIYTLDNDELLIDFEVIKSIFMIKGRKEKVLSADPEEVLSIISSQETESKQQLESRSTPVHVIKEPGEDTRLVAGAAEDVPRFSFSERLSILACNTIAMAKLIIYANDYHILRIKGLNNMLSRIFRIISTPMASKLIRIMCKDVIKGWAIVDLNGNVGLCIKKENGEKLTGNSAISFMLELESKKICSFSQAMVIVYNLDNDLLKSIIREYNNVS